MENVTKSIIYGNTYQNRYGKFLPVCSSIADRSAIGSILQYLRDTYHFKKYNRIAYAFRVEEIPVVFITEKKNVQSQYYDGCHSDETIEGSGQKLLHLLQKFNIRNVFIGIMVQQFNPLLPFQTTNYRAIVQNCRILLDELYKKVVALQDVAQIRSFNDLLLHNNQTTKLKKCNFAETIEFPMANQKKLTVKQRPNHIYTNGKPQFLTNNKDESNTTYQLKFLLNRCKVMKEQFQSLIDSIDEKEIQQLKYYAMYDKNLTINLILKLFTIYENIDKNYLLQEYDFSLIKQMKFEVINDKILTRLDDILKSNKKLSVDTILKSNRPVGVLFCLIQLKIKYSKMEKRITDLISKSNLNEKELSEIQKIKKNSLKYQENRTNLSKPTLQVSNSMAEYKINKF